MALKGTATEVREMLENQQANSAPSSGNGAGKPGKTAAKPAGRRTRSKVSTGRKVFVEGDGNSRWARRYRDLISAHVSDLGGPDMLSEAQLSLIRRASAIELELEQMEGKLSMSEKIDLDVFTRSTSHLRRVFETLGIERRVRDPLLVQGVAVLAPEPSYSPMRSRWAAEAAAAEAAFAPEGKSTSRAAAAESNLPRGVDLNAEAAERIERGSALDSSVRTEVAEAE